MTLGEKIISLRTLHKMSQGDLAEKLDVSRQSVSKWETEVSIPELDKLIMMSELFHITLDELVNYDSTEAQGVPIAPKGKYMFGMVTVGDKGQMVIPAKARKVFDIKPGDKLIVLGDIEQGLAMVKADFITAFFNKKR